MSGNRQAFSTAMNAADRARWDSQWAEAAWQKAVQISPAEPEPHARLAGYYLGKKDFALMIKERLAAAQGYLQCQDWAAARAQCEEVLHVDATHREAQQLLRQVLSLT